jgi:transposase
LPRRLLASRRMRAVSWTDPVHLTMPLSRHTRCHAHRQHSTTRRLSRHRSDTECGAQPATQLLTHLRPLKRNPHTGHLFVFRGRRGSLIKLLWQDGQGMCLFAPAGARVWLATGHTDMRKGFDGLASLAPAAATRSSAPLALHKGPDQRRHCRTAQPLNHRDQRRHIGGVARPSALTLSRPRRRNWRKPRACLIWPNTGSTICFRTR